MRVSKHAASSVVMALARLLRMRSPIEAQSGMRKSKTIFKMSQMKAITVG